MTTIPLSLLFPFSIRKEILRKSIRKYECNNRKPIYSLRNVRAGFASAVLIA